MFLSTYEILILIGFSATKFMFAALYMLPIQRIYWWNSGLILLVGGTVGMTLFYFLGKQINFLIDKLLSKRKRKKSPKKVFSKNNRRFISVKNKYGLWGISLLSPVLFSIPIGCFLATRFYKNNSTTFAVMLIGMVVWTIIMTFVKMMF